MASFFKSEVCLAYDLVLIFELLNFCLETLHEPFIVSFDFSLDVSVPLFLC